MRKYHYIYKITHPTSGAYYIGMHSTNNLDDGYFGSGSHLRRSVKKHGKSEHKMEILEFLPDREALTERERELVNAEILKDPDCLNIALGGNFAGFYVMDHKKAWEDPERRKRAGIRAKAFWEDPVYREKLEAALRARRLTEEQKEQRAVAVSASWAAMTDETRELRAAKIRATCKANYKSGVTGKFWVVNQEGRKLITPDELQSHLAQGFRRGMK